MRGLEDAEPVEQIVPESVRIVRKFNEAVAHTLLTAASRSGDPGAISLAAQLAGAAPCEKCGYVNYRCKCASPQAAQTEAQEREADGFSTPEVRELAEFAVDLYGVLPETCTKEEVNAFELGWKAGRAGRKP